MIYTVYYIIRPLQSLLKLLLKYQGIVSYGTRAHVWKREEGGYHPPEPEDLTIHVKLIFLARLRFDLARYSKPLYQELLNALMGEPPYEVSIFDKWWSIERLELDNDFAGLLTDLSADDLSLLAPTGMEHIDHWLESVIELKKSGQP